MILAEWQCGHGLLENSQPRGSSAVALGFVYVNDSATHRRMTFPFPLQSGHVTCMFVYMPGKTWARWTLTP